MAQTGYTPILIYSSSTTTNAPAVGNLTNSTLGSELAINITDGKLFYKDNANAIQVIGWKTTPTTAGGTGLTSYTAGDLLYYATGTTLSKLAIGASTNVLTSSGSAPQWTAQSALSVGTASNLKSNATTGVMQITGPAAASTRVMTIPDANFTAARTDSAQTFSGLQTFASGVSVTNNKLTTVYGGGGDFVAVFQNTSSATPYNTWIKDAATPTAGYPLLYVSDSSGVTTYFRVDSNTGNVGVAGSPSASASVKLLVSGSSQINSGNLIIGTSGNGIDFSATPGTGTSELLADYEEGDWTPVPTASSGAITSYTLGTCNYTKVGRMVAINFSVTITNAGTASGSLDVPLPFTNGAAIANGSGRENALTGSQLQARVAASGTNMNIQTYANATAIATNAQIRASMTYFV